MTGVICGNDGVIYGKDGVTGGKDGVTGGISKREKVGSWGRVLEREDSRNGGATRSHLDQTYEAWSHGLRATSHVAIWPWAARQRESRGQAANHNSGARGLESINERSQWIVAAICTSSKLIDQRFQLVSFQDAHTPRRTVSHSHRG